MLHHVESLSAAAKLNDDLDVVNDTARHWLERWSGEMTELSSTSDGEMELKTGTTRDR